MKFKWVIGVDSEGWCVWSKGQMKGRIYKDSGEFRPVICTTLAPSELDVIYKFLFEGRNPGKSYEYQNGSWYEA